MKNENTYIINLEACYIYKDVVEDKKTSTKNKNKIKLYSATMPYSLETLRMDENFSDMFYYLDEKQYTNKIINITFDKDYVKWDECKKKSVKIVDKKEIRKHLYINGFILDNKKYVFYKRGAGKAKNGYALFIQKNIKEKLLNLSRLNISFLENEELDLTSLLAYESLVSSGIEFTIDLNPKTEILLIDDIYGIKFDKEASVTREIDNEIETKNEITTFQNCLSDGQNLLDESIFKKYKKSKKGFMLLRSDMFKACGFNTKLQLWFKRNEKTILYDKFGNEYNAENVKLITTPNSIKFLKFAYKFTKTKTKEEYDILDEKEKFDIDKKCYQYWLDNIKQTFGVVKCDKVGNYGNYNRTTYQLLNSIPNLTYNELMEITKEERDFVNLLKNDDAVFRNYLVDIEKAKHFEKELNNEKLELYDNIDLMNALFLVNPDIRHTQKFKKMKSKLIANYIGNLKKGKIRLKNSKYVTIISNPYEMLLASVGLYDNKSIMEGREVYCNYFESDQEFCISRNPHINAGNVMWAKNKYHKEYFWFNFTENIMAVNFFDNDMPDRLQGEDTDSDTNLIIPHPILIEKAKYCEATFATPVNKVSGISKLRVYNMDELHELDDVLSHNYIGRIVNLSQIINSYINDAFYKEEDQEIINALYQVSSKLSSLSQIEIDKSKKVFDKINMAEELTKIRKDQNLRFIKEGKVNKMVIPEFFKMISDYDKDRIFEKFNTPMDILQDILIFEKAEYKKNNLSKDFGELLVESGELEGRYRQESAEAIYKLIDRCGRVINGLKIKTCTLNEQAKRTVELKIKKDTINKLKKLKPNDATILSVLQQSLCKDVEDKFGFKKYAMLTLNVLFSAKKIQVLKCFYNKNTGSEEVLVKINNEYDYDIFGEKYQKITRKELNF